MLIRPFARGTGGALLALAVATGQASPLCGQDPTSVVVRGLVVDAETGILVRRATVTVTDAPSVQTDGNGSFLISDVTSDVVVIQVDAFGYVPLRMVVDVTTERSLLLRLAPAPQAVEGLTVVVARPEVELANAMRRIAVLTGERVATANRAELAKFGAADPFLAISSVSKVPFVNCGDREQCIITRGGRTNLRIIIDDHDVPNQLGTELLSSLSSTDIHHVVLIPNCRVMRVYTVPYFTALSRRDWAIRPFLCQ